MLEVFGEINELFKNFDRINICMRNAAPCKGKLLKKVSPVTVFHFNLINIFIFLCICMYLFERLVYINEQSSLDGTITKKMFAKVLFLS